MENKTKTNLLVWIGLILGLFFLGYFAWYGWNLAHSNPEPLRTDAANQQNSPDAKNNTQNTYNNSSVGYQLKVPSDWVIHDLNSDGQIVQFNGPTSQLVIAGASIYAHDLSTNLIGGGTDTITIAGQQVSGEEFTWTGLDKNNGLIGFESFTLKNNGNDIVVELNVPSSEDSQQNSKDFETLKQILATFQFTNVTAYDQKMAACQAIPNNSTQKIGETTRLFINLPKDIYPDKDHNLQFKTVSGNATSGYVSNGGLPGEAFAQATPGCWSYYNEFDGHGDIDLTVKSAISGMPDYKVKFIVSSR